MEHWSDKRTFIVIHSFRRGISKYNDEGCNYVRENILTSDNIGAVGEILHFESRI